MLDDLFEGLSGDFALGRGRASRRAQLVARLFFGLLGAGLCGLGAAVLARRELPPGLGEFHAMSVLFLASIGLFALFVVALGRSWRWPGRLVLASLLAMILARLVLAE